MFGTLRNIFRRSMANGQWSMVNERLTIDGIGRAPLTAETDGAELAAEALLESLVAGKNKKMKKSNNEKAAPKSPSIEGGVRGGSYYRALSEKIKAAHEQERRAAMRFVAFAEQTLAHNPHSAHSAQELAELERGLFKHQHVVERESGELPRRWQHCLATVTVLQMQTVERGEVEKVKSEK